MPPEIRLAVRDWDWITPLALGDVRPTRFTLRLERVATLPDLAADPAFDAAEISLSRYALGRTRGDETIVGVPAILMRGFRHRCIVTAKDNPRTTLRELKGARIGVTGWQDSGNTWTRAALRREGVGVEDARWFAGRLTAAHPVVDRLAGYGRPGLIEPVPDERPMLDLLREGGLDAVFTPFMPAGFFDAASPYRQLVPDFRAAEVAYHAAVGYVPGMHLLGLTPAIARAHPWLGQALGEVLEESGRMWTQKRIRYAETTPWLLDELRQVAQALPPGWDANGLAANAAMFDDFLAELVAQGLTTVRLTPNDLFPTGERTQG